MPARRLKTRAKGCYRLREIDGRRSIFAQDFTVAGARWARHAQDLPCARPGWSERGSGDRALRFRGARIEEGVGALDGYGSIFYRNTLYSGVVPQISVVMGPCVGGAVYSPALTDFVFMVNEIGNMFVTGPQVIKAVTGESVTRQQLGGAQVHNSTSGAAHFLIENEEALNQVRTLLSYLPSNNVDDPRWSSRRSLRWTRKSCSGSSLMIVANPTMFAR